MKKDYKVKIGIIIGIIVILILMMPICYVQKVEVYHNQFYTKEEIIKTSGIENKHLLDLGYFSMKEKISALPYIANVNIKYQWPGKIIIDITEKAPFAYVDFNGTYLCLNQQGQVIEQTQERYHEVPLIAGIKFSSFKNGETLPIENEDLWFVAQEAIEKLHKHDYLSKISKIDVHNIEEIHLYVDNLDVIMGDIGDFDKKIETLIQIHDKEDYTMGYLDLSVAVTKKEAYISPIT